MPSQRRSILSGFGTFQPLASRLVVCCPLKEQCHFRDRIRKPAFFRKRAMFRQDPARRRTSSNLAALVTLIPS
jgi:hypothetical protein